MGLAEFSDILWRERRLLELLVFKLEEEQLVLASGRSRWVNHVSGEVEVVLDHIKVADLTRAVEAFQLGTELDLGPNPTLLRLVDSLDEPWCTILDQHRQALLTSIHEIRAMTPVNREFLSRGQRSAQEALSFLAFDTHLEVNTSSGSSAPTPASGGLVNEASS